MLKSSQICVMLLLFFNFFFILLHYRVWEGGPHMPYFIKHEIILNYFFKTLYKHIHFFLSSIMHLKCVPIVPLPTKKSEKKNLEKTTIVLYFYVAMRKWGIRHIGVGIVLFKSTCIFFSVKSWHMFRIILLYGLMT